MEKEELIKALEEADYKEYIALVMWLFKHHKKVLREYEDKKCKGIHFMMINGEREK